MFAQRLKQLRTEKKINQIELAREIDVTQGTVGNWETGKRVPDAQMLHKIAEYFSVTIDFLLGYETDDTELVLLARNLSGIPEEDRNNLINAFKDTYNNYLKSKGL